jgi:hypothetical protein
VECEGNEDDTKGLFHTLAETVSCFLTNTKEEGRNEYCPFKEIYFDYGSPALVKYWDGEFSKKICDIGIEIGTMKTLDKVFMDDYIMCAVHYCFQLDSYFFERPIESFPAHALKLGSKKY